ncbi:LysR family transcriptional regulator [Colwellia sp. 1_MG-2023]|uniref:LysR family transcriptional regulator n=1 Tax=Colwellia sp. 1_MG-2023 TaxID=3062649 RepID=UPI0026E274AB|nr:LysR family transcriptional regulator [Colwellia sp. 1_MG-2023]MDO6445613.1 LysR family transcriptional regulator [Colwellia sp. 1_MG-2023]
MTSNTNLFDGIVIFTHVVNCRGFSAAAEKTGHSSSYISKEINKLEARLGVRLLNRTTRSISLTSEGEVYYQQCQQMVNDAEQALGELDQNQEAIKGVLKISCPVSFGLNYLQPVLSKFLKQYPLMALDIDFNDRQVDVVLDGFDLVIRATHHLEESSLICRKIFQSKGVTVASREYLKQYGRPTEPSQLTEHNCLCYSNLRLPHKWVYRSLNDKMIVVDVKSKLLCNSAQLELRMALDGHGIVRLPEFALEDALKNDQLEVLFTDYQEPAIDVYVVYPSRKYLSPKIRCFIDFIVNELPNESL